MGVAPSDLNLSQLAINGDTATLIKYLDADKELIGIKDSSLRSLLHWSSLHGQYDTCKFLIDRGANVNDQDNFKRTPLHLACEKNHADVIKLLCGRGANPNLVEDMHEYTALTYAIIHGNLDIVISLLDAGADVNYTDNAGFSPLFWACEHNRSLIILLLINRGAIFDKRMNGLHLIKDQCFRDEIMKILGVQFSTTLHSGSKLTSLNQLNSRSSIQNRTPSLENPRYSRPSIKSEYPTAASTYREPQSLESGNPQHDPKRSSVHVVIQEQQNSKTNPLHRNRVNSTVNSANEGTIVSAQARQQANNTTAIMPTNTQSLVNNTVQSKAQIQALDASGSDEVPPQSSPVNVFSVTFKSSTINTVAQATSITPSNEAAVTFSSSTQAVDTARRDTVRPAPTVQSSLQVQVPASNIACQPSRPQSQLQSPTNVDVAQSSTPLVPPLSMTSQISQLTDFNSDVIFSPDAESNAQYKHSLDSMDSTQFQSISYSQDLNSATEDSIQHTITEDSIDDHRSEHATNIPVTSTNPSGIKYHEQPIVAREFSTDMNSAARNKEHFKRLKEMEAEKKRKEREDESTMNETALKEKRAAEWQAKYHDKKKTTHLQRLGSTFAQNNILGTKSRSPRVNPSTPTSQVSQLSHLSESTENLIDSNERASAIIQKLATTTHDTEPQPSIDTSSVAQSHSIETARSTLSRNNPVLEPVVENSPSDPSDDSRPNSGGFPPDTGGLDSSGNAVTGGSGLGNRMSFSRRNSVSKEEMKLIAQTRAMANADLIRGRRNSVNYLATIRDVEENKEGDNEISTGKGDENGIRNSTELASSKIDQDNLGSETAVPTPGVVPSSSSLSSSTADGTSNHVGGYSLDNTTVTANSTNKITVVKPMLSKEEAKQLAKMRALNKADSNREKNANR